MIKEVIVVGDLESTEVQVAEVIVRLKFVETEAFGIPEEVISKVVVEENLVTSEALNTNMARINLNFVSGDDFNYYTLNHKSPTPSPNCSSNHSPKHLSSPTVEPTFIHNHITLYSYFEQPLPLNIMLEPPIDISSGKAYPSNSESEYDEVGFDAHLGLKYSTPKHLYIEPIQDILIQTFSPQNQQSNKTCSASEVKHVTIIQPETTSLPEIQPPQPLP